MDPDQEPMAGYSFSIGAVDAEGISGTGKKPHDPGMGLGNVLDQPISVIDKIIGGIVDSSPLQIDSVTLGEGNDMGKAGRVQADAEGGSFRCIDLGAC
jgi:hypothetical protein